jgi:hypothetical protein
MEHYMIINKLESYNPRSDRSKHYWFRVDNNIRHSRALSKLDPDQCWAFICFIGMANESDEKRIPHDLEYLAKETGVSIKRLEKMIDTLTKNKTISLVDEEGCENVDINVDTKNPQMGADGCLRTDVQTDRHNKQDRTGQGKAVADNSFSPKGLAELWNEKASEAHPVKGSKRKSMPLVDIKRLRASQERFKSAKARVEEEPDRDYWVVTVNRILASEFCRGQNDRGWLADFDFLVRPETHVRVNEGKYDSSAKAPISEDYWDKVFEGKGGNPQ